MRNVFLFILFLSVMSFTYADVICLENPSSLGTTGWSNAEQTFCGDYGYVHGMWGSDVPYVEKTFATSGQTSITISFRYWAVDTWDSEVAYLNFNGSQLWSKTAHHPYGGWAIYSGSFPAPFSGGTGKYYEDVTVTTAFTGTSFTLRFGSTINQAEEDESWGFSALSISNNVVPEPSSLVFLGIALVALGFLKKRF
ncbi:MAG: PEP-CTERM sorting domain-containing protein [Candidatus Brocadiae bacterium]|nr:PEP-CTERM sorting domain-containing protein [Candidatus Brocadiia bacterium]